MSSVNWVDLETLGSRPINLCQKLPRTLLGTNLNRIKLGLLRTVGVIQSFHKRQNFGHEDLAGIVCSACKMCVHAHSLHALRILSPNLGLMGSQNSGFFNTKTD